MNTVHEGGCGGSCQFDRRRPGSTRGPSHRLADCPWTPARAAFKPSRLSANTFERRLVTRPDSAILIMITRVALAAGFPRDPALPGRVYPDSWDGSKCLERRLAASRPAATRVSKTPRLTALLILVWQVAPPVNDRYARCRDSVNEAIHCTPSFLINLG
jgi:hypothetical protein